MKKEKEISDAEWEVMRVVWANIEVTSREIINVLINKMDWTESTIKTLIGRLVDKGALNTEKEGRAFIYSANISEKETVNSYSDEILSRVCNKKDVLVLEHLVQDAALSQKDIKKLIAQLKDKLEDA
ncbi:MAG: CopY/TcrY family copper transport repressor, partial [Atopostipes sp.]|nr:CopY/TcrY family copper transport repressor [Atopostipes sp.]